MKKFKLGDMVVIATKGLQYSTDGFAMAAASEKEDTMVIFEEINIHTYPSTNDFNGYCINVKEGDVAIILRHVGRPERVKRDPAWFKYDIYEIFVRGTRCQVFRQNIKKPK